MKEKGFTLIELLAVIVILAIIALIATPIILGIINDARVETQERSVELYENAVELAVARKNLTEDFNPSSCIISNGIVTCDGIKLKVELDGETPKEGTIIFKENKIESAELVFEKYKATINENGKITITDKTETTPTITKACEVTSGDGSSAGDIITCTLKNGDEDKFYVVSNDGTNIEMLTELNIDLTTYQQSATAQYITFTSDVYPNYYWVVNDIYSPAGDSRYDYVYDSNSNTYSIVNNYVSYLNQNGLTEATGKLMSYEQVEKITVEIFDNETDGWLYTGPAWLFTPDYWLGNSIGEYILYTRLIEPYDTKFCLHGHTCTPFNPEYEYAGVRPVITISISELQ